MIYHLSHGFEIFALFLVMVIFIVLMVNVRPNENTAQTQNLAIQATMQAQLLESQAEMQQKQNTLPLALIGLIAVMIICVTVVIVMYLKPKHIIVNQIPQINTTPKVITENTQLAKYNDQTGIVIIDDKYIFKDGELIGEV